MIEEIRGYAISILSDKYSLDEIKKYIDENSQDIYRCTIYLYKEIRMDRFCPEMRNMFTVNLHTDNENLYSYSNTVDSSPIIGFEDGASKQPYLRNEAYMQDDLLLQEGYRYEGYLVIHKDSFSDVFK